MEPDFARLYAKRFFFLLLGAVPIALIWNVQNRWIAIPISIVAVLFILVQLNLINGIADAQLAYSRAKRAEAESYLQTQPASAFKQKWVYNSSIAFFFLLAVFITFTGQEVKYYLDWKPLLFDMLKLLWIPFVVAWLYHKKWKVAFEDKEKKIMCSCIRL